MRHDGYHLDLGLNDETVEALATSSETSDLHGIVIVVSFKCTVASSWVSKYPGRSTTRSNHNRLLQRGAFSQRKGEIDDSVLTFRVKELVSRFKALVRKRAVFSPLVHGNNSGVPSARYLVLG